jgi:hypothetical protein
MPLRRLGETPKPREKRLCYWKLPTVEGVG